MNHLPCTELARGGKIGAKVIDLPNCEQVGYQVNLRESVCVVSDRDI